MESWIELLPRWALSAKTRNGRRSARAHSDLSRGVNVDYRNGFFVCGGCMWSSLAPPSQEQDPAPGLAPRSGHSTHGNLK